MARFCSSCGVQMQDDATFCPSCGKGSAAAGGATPAPAAGATGGMTDNVAGLLAYVTIIPAIIFLLVEPYNKNRFIRFHAFQCVFLVVALIALHFAIGIFAFVPVLALVTFPLHMLISLGAFVLWIVLLLKAYQGQKFKLPIIGEMAEKQANLV